MREKRVQSGGRNGGRQSVVVSPEGIGPKEKNTVRKRLDCKLFHTQHIIEPLLLVRLYLSFFWLGTSGRAPPHGSRSIDELPQRASACISVQMWRLTSTQNWMSPHMLRTLRTLRTLRKPWHFMGWWPRPCHLQKSSAHLHSRTWRTLVLTHNAAWFDATFPHVPRGGCLVQFVQEHLVRFAGGKKNKTCTF